MACKKPISMSLVLVLIEVSGHQDQPLALSQARCPVLLPHIPLWSIKPT